MWMDKQIFLVNQKIYIKRHFTYEEKKKETFETVWIKFINLVFDLEDTELT